MQKKILIIAPGNSIHTYKWVKEMSKYFDVYSFSLEKPHKSIYDILPMDKIYECDRIYNRGSKIKLIRVILHFFLLLIELKRVIKELKPDIINAHFLGCDSAFAVYYNKILKYNSKLVMSTWGSDVLIAPRKSKIKLWLLKYIFKNADIVTCECEYVKDAIISIYEKTKVYKFIFGVEHFDDNVKVTDKNYNCIFSNRMLKSIYNIDEVVILFSKLLKINSNYSLYIAGDGDKKETIKKIANELGVSDRITFLGMLSQDEQDLYYKMCGYYVSIPSSDSISVSLLEAMSYGCIPIVSDLPSNRELILDGVNGYIYDESKIDYPIIENAFDYNRKYIKEHGIMENLFFKFVDDCKLNGE